MKSVIDVNGVKLNVDDLTIDNKGEEDFRTISFTVNVIGKSNHNLIHNLLNDNLLKIYIPEKDLSLLAKISNSSYSYKDILDENTPLSIKYELHEVNEEDKKFKSDKQIQADALLFTAESQIELKALCELLVEKGIISNEEIDKKYEDVYDRDLVNIMNNLILEKSDQSEE